MNFGQRLLKELKKHNKKYGDKAALMLNCSMGTHTETILMWVINKPEHYPTPDQLIIMSKVFAVSVDYLENGK